MIVRKTAAELEKMRRSGLLVWNILQKLKEIAVEGATTMDLEVVAEKMISDAGAKPAFKGFRGGALVKTGERDFCFVGEWSGFQRIADARPIMIGLLDGMREYLEDLGNGLGLTDPVSGEVVVTLRASKRPPRKTAKRKKAKRKMARK